MTLFFLPLRWEIVSSRWATVACGKNWLLCRPARRFSCQSRWALRKVPLSPLPTSLPTWCCLTWPTWSRAKVFLYTWQQVSWVRYTQIHDFCFMSAIKNHTVVILFIIDWTKSWKFKFHHWLFLYGLLFSANPEIICAIDVTIKFHEVMNKCTLHLPLDILLIFIQLLVCFLWMKCFHNWIEIMILNVKLIQWMLVANVRKGEKSLLVGFTTKCNKPMKPPPQPHELHVKSHAAHSVQVTNHVCECSCIFQTKKWSDRRLSHRWRCVISLRLTREMANRIIIGDGCFSNTWHLKQALQHHMQQRCLLHVSRWITGI